MTMPHLMNCAHNQFGWCIQCVKKEHEKHEAEIARLQSRLEISPEHSYDGIDCRDVTIRELEKEVSRLNAENARQHALFNEESAIINNIWTMLGDPSYEDLKGRTIYDLIADLQKDAATLRAKVIEECASKFDDGNKLVAKAWVAETIRALAAPCDQQEKAE